MARPLNAVAQADIATAVAIIDRCRTADITSEVVSQHVRVAPEDTIHVSVASMWSEQPDPRHLFAHVVVPAVQHVQRESLHSRSSQAPLRQVLLDAMPTLPADIIDLVLDFSLHLHLPLYVTPRMGRRHADSKAFPPLAPSTLALLLSGFSVRQIIGWGNEYANGVEFVYGPAHVSLPPDADLEGKAGFITVRFARGSHHQPQRTRFVLSEHEFITQVRFDVGEFGDSLRFTTSNQRTFRIGRRDNARFVTMHAPVGTALIALTGAVGGHLHNIGCVWASTQPAVKLGQEEDQDMDEE